MAGPLTGTRVIEFDGLGPGPFAAMMLADAGAEVVTIQRPAGKTPYSMRDGARDALVRGRIRLTLDLRRPEGLEVLLRLVETSDALIEGHRPGTMERLGAGPDVCLARRPQLVYARMTGWGQAGPLAHAAGHDLNYISLTGALHAIGTEAAPVPPLNLVGDFGGGGMMLAFGIVAALLHARASGQGQVVDAAMCDGAALMMAPFYGLVASGAWVDRRESNTLDGGVPWYDVYRCADGRFVSVAALEPAFFARLVELLGLPQEAYAERADRSLWPRLRERLQQCFAGKARDEWCALLEGTDACFAPVLAISEAPSHAHLHARGTFMDVEGVAQPAPAPRFSRTPGQPRQPGALRPVSELLLAAGMDDARQRALVQDGVIQF